MNEWTHISGNHTSKRVSIKKLIRDIMTGEDIVGQYNDREFDIRFEDSGDSAAKSLEKFIKEFKRMDPKAHLSFTATIEYSF